MLKERRKKLWLEINKSTHKPDSFLITNPKNVFFLTNFTGEGILLSTPGKYYLITDSRYCNQAKQEAYDCEIIIQDLQKEDAQNTCLSNLLAELKITELGFEANYLKVADYLKYQQIMPYLKLIPFNDIIEKIRMIKDQSEIAFIAEAAQIANKSFYETVSNLSEGITELILANQLNYNMRKNGAKKEAFDLIVTSGERGTLIHGEPSNKKIKAGELIIVDFGSVYNMYHSDCTRTLIIGEADKRQKEVYNIIKEVQEKILQQVKAGIECSKLDKLARAMIEEKGYGTYFQHSLGHGVGLDIHELPYLNSHQKTILQANMVVTIEPGIYLPGLGGVRLEDTIVVTETGCHILTNLPKQLMLCYYLEK